MPKFKVGTLIQHIHAGDKNWDSRPYGICMVVEIVPPSNNLFGPYQEDYYYKLIMPYGSGQDDDDQIESWSPSFIENNFVEVK